MGWKCFCDCDTFIQSDISPPYFSFHFMNEAKPRPKYTLLLWLAVLYNEV